ncbi:MAG: thioredoxin family protein [Candidatus Aminicenantes bacterium]|nr:thioredoxin family protein [Candidatus Aminicenantes bacterium]
MKKISIMMLALAFFLNSACSQQHESTNEYDQSSNTETVQKSLIVTGKLELDFSKYKVTFIELGADRCIPCRAMQPIMREIAEEFKGQVQVVFYDVWKDPRPGRKYRIQLIPTQVFIDKNGKEFFRHVGYFPKEEILKVLKQKGVG